MHVYLLLALLAGLLHLVIFYLESFAWDSARAREVFSIGSVSESQATKSMAFNQGFYNLFLALITFAGVIAVLIGATAGGIALLCAGLGSMLAAAFVLLVSSRSHRAAAIKQGVLPLLGLIALAVAI